MSDYDAGYVQGRADEAALHASIHAQERRLYEELEERLRDAEALTEFWKQEHKPWKRARMNDTWTRAEFELQLAETLLEQAEYDLSIQQARVDTYRGRVEFWKRKMADER